MGTGKRRAGREHDALVRTALVVRTSAYRTSRARVYEIDRPSLSARQISIIYAPAQTVLLVVLVPNDYGCLLEVL